MDDEARSIIEAIHAAFRSVSRGAITLHEAEAIDDFASDEERLAARELDTEQRWEDIPEEHVEKCGYALAHLDPVSWRYYVPRFMEWSIRNFRSNDSFVSDLTIYTFNPSIKDSALAEHDMERYQKLTAEQAHVVSLFLRYMANNGDVADDRVAKDALRKYWASFGPPPAA